MRVSFLLLTILVIAVGGAFLYWHYHAVTPAPVLVTDRLDLGMATPAVAALQAYILPAANSGSAPIRDTRIPDPDPDASEALLEYVDSGTILYQKNANTQVPVASLTKLVSALVVRDLFQSDDIVTVASGSVRVDGEKQTLYLNERIKVRDLLAMMLVESSNDAAYALASYAQTRGVDFIAAMNAKARTLGMNDCLFRDPAGLDDTAYCTAVDMMRVVTVILHQASDLLPIMATKELVVHSADGTIDHEVKSTDELLGVVPGIIGGKTGNTDAALGCLILVVKLPDDRGTLASVVLGSRARFSDTQLLVSWAQQAYRFP